MLILENKVDSAVFNDEYFAKIINGNPLEQINGKIRPVKVSYAHQSNF